MGTLNFLGGFTLNIAEIKQPLTFLMYAESTDSPVWQCGHT